MIVRGVIAALVLLITVFVARSVINATQFSPTGPVEDYMAALGRGDAEAALAIAESELPFSEQALLSNEVYEKVEGRPDDVEVRTVRRDGDAAVVEASWELDGSTVEQEFSVVRDGSSYGIFDRWKLSPPEVPVVDLTNSMDGGTPAVVVNGVEMKMPDPDSPRFAALPGMWEVTLPDRAPLVTAPTIRAPVGGVAQEGLPVYVTDTLEYTMTPAALEAAEGLARAELDTCLASRKPDPPGCPFRDVNAQVAGAPRVTWTLTTTPTITATAYDSTTIRVAVADGMATTRGGEAQPDAGAAGIDYTVEYTMKDGRLVKTENFGAS
ncbi:hypothetical protein KV097_05345 [Mumia sp. zg.B17]|uniref:hypothetical protein n=1 Tax=Mumia sp. zg.B17 TaxID=2855446 RepID=UPI001C6E99BE|nr:hypothetical protein [Mumia sp. zg.B17]MBW9205363.1 hypothetical protein [Mumia sp. zg.B17]